MDEEFRALGGGEEGKKKGERKEGTADEFIVAKSRFAILGCGAVELPGLVCVETIFILPPRGKWNYVFR